MTYEEIHNRIMSGLTPSTLEEAGSDITILSACAEQIDQELSLVLYESKRLHGVKGWVDWVQERYPIYADRAVFFRRCVVGEILAYLREGETSLFRAMLKTDVTKLEVLAVIYNRKDGKDGKATLVNFLRQYYKADWSRERLIAERNRYMGKSDSGVTQGEQLTFDFDVFAPQEPTDIASRIESLQLQPAYVGQLVRNGVVLCSTALPYMAAHPEAFDAEDVPYLEEMRDRMEQAARELGDLIAGKIGKAVNA